MIKLSSRLILTIIILLLVLVKPAWAELNYLKHASGIFNERQYQEVVFITGEPILMTGTAEVRPGRERNGTMDIRYTIKLENKEQDATLTRNITLLIAKDQGANSQEIKNLSLSRYNERVDIGNARYELTDYQYSKSLLSDVRPAVTYYSGAWTERKTYTLNRNVAEIVIETIGDGVGYQHNWGNTEAQHLQYQLASKSLENNQNERHNWVGNGTVQLAFNFSKELFYQNNEPTQISFPGGYNTSTKWENILSYTASLPQTNGNGELTGRNVSYSNRIILSSMPVITKLPSHQIFDIRGHWAQQAIERLVGLGAFNSEGAFFGPALPMRRSEFAKAIVVITDMETEITAEEEAIFADVPSTHRDYEYIVKVQKLGVIKGLGPNQFAPDGELTRAQAITIMIRALGLEGIAPNPGFKTNFVDNNTIPNWAMDSIYVAQEIGLVMGDSHGYLWPNDILTRAEAAIMIDRFINYMQAEIKEDYRERLINFR
ncbi:MAG: S-layer homology domain-containing protein [Bacillota bacterium]|nr:S-layer homology domain-containing protein [Bacillota bacterium]